MKFKEIECISFYVILLCRTSDVLYNLNSAQATNMLYVCIKLAASLQSMKELPCLYSPQGLISLSQFSSPSL